MKKEDILNSIEEFKNLENNWDGHGAIPLSLGSAKNAKELNESLSNELFENFYDDYPNTHDMVSFEWKSNNRDDFFVEIGNKMMSYYLTSKEHITIKKDFIEFSTENIKIIKTYIQSLN